jgi:hypothetical protein
MRLAADRRERSAAANAQFFVMLRCNFEARLTPPFSSRQSACD